MGFVSVWEAGGADATPDVFPPRCGSSSQPSRWGGWMRSDLCGGDQEHRTERCSHREPLHDMQVRGRFSGPLLFISFSFRATKIEK